MSNIQKTSTIPPTQIDDVLQRIQANEKAKGRKNQFALVVITLLLAGIGFAAFLLLQPPHPTPLAVFPFAELDSLSVQVALQNEQNAIMVQHPDLGTETIRSVEDYANLARISEALALMSVQETTPVTDTTATLPEFTLDIAGQRMAGERLVFTIEDYDPEVSYLLDFGNGQRRKVKQRSSYRYPRPGRFALRLLASKGEVNSLSEKRFQIVPAKPAQSTPQIARREAPASQPSSSRQELEESLFEANDASPLQSVAAAPEEALSPVESEEEPTVSAAESTPAPSPDRVYMTSDLPPSFPGGQNGLQRFIRRNFRYTDAAVKAKADGAVILRFVVNTDGSLSDVTIVRGIGYGLDEEALSLIEKMPPWNPGELDGQKVRVYHTMPITVRLLK